MNSWVASLGVVDVIADALCANLQDPTSGVEQLAFVRECGGRHRHGAIRAALLRDSARLLESLATRLERGVDEMTESIAATAIELHDKFATDPSAFTLEYASTEHSSSVLEELVGPPSPHLYKQMCSEHTAKDDACIEFTSSNHNITTTSAIEWLFVVSPLELADEELASVAKGRVYASSSAPRVPPAHLVSCIDSFPLPSSRVFLQSAPPRRVRAGAPREEPGALLSRLWRSHEGGAHRAAAVHRAGVRQV